jgi:translation initiation factor 2B subunit (eIF-2B alpha/beta/delta family)
MSDSAPETLRRCLEDLERDREHGAGELARGALAGLGRHVLACRRLGVAEVRSESLRAARALQTVRPAMAPIENLVGRWMALVESVEASSGEELALRLEQEAGRLVESSRRAAAAAAAYAAEAIDDGSTILTHSLSSTVLAVFERLAKRQVRAVVSESRPLLEGRETARRLVRMGVPTELVTDAQLGLCAARVDLALIGADTVCADGAVVNKAGTYLLALAMRAAGKPVWVCFESFKRSSRTSAEVRLEEKAPEELGVGQPEDLVIRNVYFDVTPARLVSRWIDEQGVLDG